MSENNIPNPLHNMNQKGPTNPYKTDVTYIVFDMVDGVLKEREEFKTRNFKTMVEAMNAVAVDPRVGKLVIMPVFVTEMNLTLS